MKNKFNYILQNLKNDKHFYEILSDSSISFMAKILGLLLGFGLNLIIARYYGAKELGVYSIVSSVFAMTLILGVMGINTSILRLLPEQIVKYTYNSAYYLFWKTFKIVLISSIVLSIGLYMFSWEIAEDIFHKTYLYPLFLLVAYTIIFQSLGNLSIASIRALRNIKLYAFFQIFSQIVQIISLILLTLFLYQDFNTVYALMISYILTAVVALYALIKLFAQKREKTDTVFPMRSKNIVMISLPMMITTVMSFIVTQTDILMLGSMSSIESVGIYAVVMKLALLTSFVLASVNIVLAPKISELYYSHKHDELQSVVQKTTKLIALLSLPIVIVLMVFGELILSFFGSEFVIGYVALLLLLIGQIFNVFSGPAEFFLNMTGHQKELNIITIACAILNIVSNYFFIPIYGIEGAACASMISLLAMKIVTLVYIKMNFGFYMIYLPALGIKK